MEFYVCHTCTSAGVPCRFDSVEEHICMNTLHCHKVLSAKSVSFLIWRVAGQRLHPARVRLWSIAHPPVAAWAYLRDYEDSPFKGNSCRMHLTLNHRRPSGVQMQIGVVQLRR